MELITQETMRMEAQSRQSEEQVSFEFLTQLLSVDRQSSILYMCSFMFWYCVCRLEH